MAYCGECKSDVVPSVTIDGRNGAVRVCPNCGHTLQAPERVDSYDAKAPAVLRRTEPQAHPILAAAADRGMSLPAIIRERKRALRRAIRDAKRELAQLERLTSPRARKSGTVTPIKRSAT